MKNDAPQEQFVCEVLPADARAILQRAAATRITDDPMARTKAIARATKTVKLMYPNCFKTEPEPDYFDTPKFADLNK